MMPPCEYGEQASLLLFSSPVRFVAHHRDARVSAHAKGTRQRSLTTHQVDLAPVRSLNVLQGFAAPQKQGRHHGTMRVLPGRTGPWHVSLPPVWPRAAGGPAGGTVTP